jgi:hypothetical protein
MTARVLLGKRGNDRGLWISKPGVDVTNLSLGADDFLVTSNGGGTCRVVLSGSLDKLYRVEAAGSYSVYRYVITHNLGYVPLYWVDFQPNLFVPQVVATATTLEIWLQRFTNVTGDEYTIPKSKTTGPVVVIPGDPAYNWVIFNTAAP